MTKFLKKFHSRVVEVRHTETIILARNLDELLDKIKEWNREEKPVAIFRFEITRTDVRDWQADIHHL